MISYPGAKTAPLLLSIFDFLQRQRQAIALLRNFLSSIFDFRFSILCMRSMLNGINDFENFLIMAIDDHNNISHSSESQYCQKSYKNRIEYLFTRSKDRAFEQKRKAERPQNKKKAKNNKCFSKIPGYG